MKVSVRYIIEDVDRHGNVRLYFRRNGRKTRIRHATGTPAFLAEYEALLAGSASGELQPIAGRQPVRGTWRWLCVAYLASPPFRALDPGTQRTRRLILESTWSEPVFPGARETYADFPLDRVTTKALRVLRDRKKGPAAGNNRVRAIRAVYAWALAEDLVRTNPAADLARNALPGHGWHTWTPDEIVRFEMRFPVGTRARLALALLMYTGVRRSDVVRLGRQHERDGRLSFRPWKTRREGTVVDIPILPALAEIIVRSPTGDLTYLVTDAGKPYTVAGFGNWFRERCDEAGLPHCSAHGVRKAGATLAAENGATPHQLMAIFGWRKVDLAEHYTRAADRARLATSASDLLAWPVGQSPAQSSVKSGKP